MWWVRSDICGLFSAGFTVLLLLYAQFVMVTVVILPWYGFSIHVPMYTAVTLLALISHCRAQFTNPGAVPLDLSPPPAPTTPIYNIHGQEIPPPVPRTCRRCKTLKPYKAHHCSNCGRCIIRMDHHCPWVNNCVAIFNQKYFLLFLIYTALCCLYSGVLLVARFISCTNNLKQCTVSGMQAILCVLNFIEAIIFGLFCTIMLWDQLSAIFDNTPGIDALQNKRGVKRGKYQSLVEVFGEEFNWRWWMPFDLPKKVAQDFIAECALMDDPNMSELQQLNQQHYEDLAAHNQLPSPVHGHQHHAQNVGIQLTPEQLQQQYEIAASRAANAVQGGGHKVKAPESIADFVHSQQARKATSSSANTGDNGTPIVYPDGFKRNSTNEHSELLHNHDDEVDEELLEAEATPANASYNPLLASLQSPPHSPVLSGLQPRHLANKND